MNKLFRKLYRKILSRWTFYKSTRDFRNQLMARGYRRSNKTWS